jgi:2-hydroxy-3-oxopropionate reductase
MLPNSPHVLSVVLGENGVSTSVRSGSTLIDMSSINPIDSQKIAAELAKKGVEMLDAPVSGGEPKAIDGTLAFMVGGKKEVFEEFKSLLEKMGSSVVRCGDIGAGNTAKLVNQIIVAMNIAAVSEAFMLAKKSGVDPQIVFEAIKGGLAGSTVMDAKIPMILDNNFKPGFKIDLHIKDLNNALEAAHTVGTPLPFTASVMEILQNLHTDGFGQYDHSAIAKYYEKLTGTSIGQDL